MKLDCPCGRSEIYGPETWSRPRRLAETHIHGIKGAIWKSTHRRCKRTKIVTDAMGKTMLSVWNAAESRILRAS